MNTLYIRTNKKTHKPEYIGKETPLENGGAILHHIYGNPNAIIEPVEMQDCDTCKQHLNNQCNPDKDEDLKNCPFDKAEEKQQ